MIGMPTYRSGHGCHDPCITEATCNDMKRKNTASDGIRRVFCRMKASRQPHNALRPRTAYPHVGLPSGASYKTVQERRPPGRGHKITNIHIKPARTHSPDRTCVTSRPAPMCADAAVPTKAVMQQRPHLSHSWHGMDMAAEAILPDVTADANARFRYVPCPFNSE